MSDLHTAVKTLERVLAEAKKSERHRTVAETRYWCDQYKQIANEAIRHFRQALANEALDKMAENARELGLDYEPARMTIDASAPLVMVPHPAFQKPAQRTWVGLTMAELDDFANGSHNRLAMCCAIEAKLKQRNT